MGNSAPRLRSDLTVSNQHSAGESFWVVKDPVSSEFFRLREVERFIAEQLDGATSLESVRRRTEARFGAALSPETLRGFVRRLSQAGLLETPGAKHRSDRRAKRVRGGLLHLRIKLFDPSRLLDAMIPRVRFAFTPWFMVFTAGIILLGAGVTVAHWNRYAEEMTGLLRFSTIPMLLALGFLVVSAHELAHGLTCRRFGGQVREMGFMLIYFQPALYCNVSDAWLFPEKSRRLWVSFAGAYFELFLWGLAALTWRLTETDTWINYVALIVMTTSGIKTLLNFNPLIKLDGYYMLSDALEIPNLRRKAFRYVGARIEGIFGGRRPLCAAVSPRERRIYLAYGLVAAAGSFALLFWVLVSVGGSLIAIGQPLLLALLTALVGVKLRHRVRRLFGKADRSDPSDDGDDDGSVDPEGPGRPVEQKRREGRRAWVPLFWAGVLCGAAAGLFFGRLELRVSGPFSVLPVENAEARAAVEGIVEEVFVDEGDRVEAGAPIARLSGGALLSELEKVEAEIVENSATLRKLVAGPTPVEIDVGRAVLSKATDQLQYARERLDRFKRLFEEGLASQMAYEDARHAVSLATNERLEHERRLDLLLVGTRPEEIEATKARLARFEAQKRFIQAQLGLLDVVSPVTGVIATPSRELKLLPRQLVKKGDLISRVYDVSTITAHILVPEADIADIRQGQDVILRARSHPGHDFRGTVSFIATSVQGDPGRGGAGPSATIAAVAAGGGATRSVLVTTEIDNRLMLLKPEMTGQAKILCGKRSIVALIERRLARTLKVEFWSWW